MISFHLEPWATYRADPALGRLWAAHYAELRASADMPMGVDEGFYVSQEAAGVLQVMTVRQAGKLIGYCLLLIKPHPHYSSVLCAFEDSYYIHPEHRKGGLGFALIKRSCEAASARGARQAYFMTKLALDMGKLFERLGGVETDRVFRIPLEK